MILNAVGLKLKRQAHGDFRGRHFEAALIVTSAPSWNYRPRGHSTAHHLFSDGHSE